MNTISQLCRPCRIVWQAGVVWNCVPKQVTFKPVTYNHTYIMSQRIITSFFKVTPPKPVVEDRQDEVKVNGDVKDDTSPVQTKSISKRPRLESSDSDASPKKVPTSPVPSSNKKNKIKRQRIESSGSESEKSPKSEQNATSPQHNDEKAIKEETESPSKQIVTKSNSPKTYASPKTKKKKVLAERNTKEKDGKRKKTTKLKNEKESIESEVKSPSVKVKKEEDDSSIKSKSKRVMSGAKETNGVDEGLVPEAEYDPSKSKYHPIKDACWAAGVPVPYLALARTLELIEATSARLKIIDILANYLRSVIVLTPEDLVPSVYMCLNQLAPAYHSLELGIAETYLMKAIGQCTGRSLSQVRALATRHSDLGHVAGLARATQRTMFAAPVLTTRKVFAALKEIAHMTGQASVNKKINKIQSLYVACRHSEAKYLIRSLEGKLRIGLAEQSVLQALAVATAGTPPGAAGVTVLDASKDMSADEFKARVDAHALTIKSAYCACPDYDALLAALLRHGVTQLPRHCRLQPGVPLKPMLAHPTKAVTDIFDRFESEQFTCEWKYDGERAQLHVPAGEGGEGGPDLARAAIFSRNQENNTSKYPDVLSRLPSLLRGAVSSCVLDCEAVAYDVEHKQILPFQILSTRKRKDAVVGDIKVQVCVFVFDLLYLNGTPLVDKSLRERRDLLREHFQEKEGEWQFATSQDCSSVEEVQQFLEASVKGSCEGLMVKALDGAAAKYDIARRSHNWLKLKKDYLEGVGDTLDLVVIGAYPGRGKRAGVFGGFLLACYDPQSEEYQSICKVGTGFSDEDLQKLSETLNEHIIDAPRSYYSVSTEGGGCVWLSARCVWEVRGADLSLSPAHRAAIGLVQPDRGVSLRFPRFIRIRDDKTPEQATTAQQVAEMYLSQDQVKNLSKNSKKTNADDFY